MIDLGDRRLGDDFSFMFTTYGQTGSPKDMDNGMFLGCYRGVNGAVAASEVELLSTLGGFTQPAIHDGRPGLYRVDVDMDNDSSSEVVDFFLAGHDYFFVARGGTVDNVQLNGVCIATFSVANRLMLPFVSIEGAVKAADGHPVPTTTAFTCTGVTGGKAANFYANQAVLWTSGNLKGLSFFITASDTGDTDALLLTLQTMPVVPAVTDTFIILGTKGS